MKMQTHFLRKKMVPSLFLLLGLCSSISFAAGPRYGDFYLNLGGGIFTPDFVINRSSSLKTVDGEPHTTYIGLSAPFVGVDQPLQIIGVSGTSNATLGQPENRQILSLGASLGYRYNRLVSFEAHLDLGFPNILIRDIHVADVLGSDTKSSGRVQVLAPELLPLGGSVTYTFLPDALISPYVGAGLMIALLDNRRAQSQPTDIMTIDGGVEIGYLIHTGAYLNLSNSKFGFFDLKYASIDSPDFTTRQGEPAPVDRVDIRHIRVGVGTRF